MGIYSSDPALSTLNHFFFGLQRYCGFTTKIYECNRRPEMVCMQERFKPRKNDSEWMAQDWTSESPYPHHPPYPLDPFMTSCFACDALREDRTSIAL
jgi:hypothetical protein